MTSPAQPSWHASLPDTIAERYRVVRKLGSGGMGEAFLADDTLLHRQVVLKRMSPDLARKEEDRARILSEAKRAAAINNTHIVQIYDVLDLNGELLLVLEYVAGATLRMPKRRRMEVEEFFPIALQIADGVAAAHAAHVIHCDLKPDNIILTPAHVVKILDFGLARQSSQQDAATVSLSHPKFAGTPGYMAPEMVREQEVDERCDIFALGVIYYELLTGTAPFHCPTLLDTLHRTVHEDPPAIAETNPLVPPELDWILSKMLAKSRDERYTSVREIITDLTASQRKLQSGISSRTWTHVTPPPKQRKPYIAIAAFVVVLTLVVFFLYRKLSPPPPPPSEHYRSVAVIPFQLVGDAGHGVQAYADGICFTLTSKLARIADAHQLQVTPASEVRRRSLANASAARQQLGADLVLEGQVETMGKAVRINYSLVDTRTMSQLRSESVDGSLDDPFTLEDKIVSGALNLLNVQLEAAERQSIGQRGTINAAAYDLFLTGSGYLREYADPGNVDRAIESFQGALLRDASYTQAEAALGRAYWQKYELTHEPALVTSARTACESAIQKNAGSPDSHLCLGIVSAGSGQYETAAKELEVVINAEPSNDTALRELANVYERMNKPGEAEQVYQRGIAAQPHYWAGYSHLASFYARHARYSEAESQYQKAIAQAPGNGILYYSLGGIYIYQGRNPEAVDVLKKAVELQPTPDAYRNLGQAYLHIRNFDSAIDALQKAIALGAREYAFYSALGDAYSWSRTHAAEAPAAYRQSNQLALEQAKVNPRDPASNIMLAYNYAALGDESHAFEYLKLAQQEAPADSEILFFAARIHARLNHPNEAANWLKQAIEHGYSKADIRGCPDLDAVVALPEIKQALGS